MFSKGIYICIPLGIPVPRSSRRKGDPFFIVVFFRDCFSFQVINTFWFFLNLGLFLGTDAIVGSLYVDVVFLKVAIAALKRDEKIEVFGISSLIYASLL